VAISQRIGAKSYTSLHTLVNDMFPPTSLVEQVRNHLHKFHILMTSLNVTPKNFKIFISEYCRRTTTHGIIGECHCQML